MTKRFQRCALVGVGALVAGLVAVAVTHPLERATAVPKASIRLAVSEPVPPAAPPPAEAPVAPPPAEALAANAEAAPDRIPDAAGIDTLTGIITVNAQQTHFSARLLRTVDDLADVFERLGYDLKQVRTGKAPVPRLFLSSLPGDLKDVREVAHRKSLFFRTLLPLVLRANEDIRQDRRRLWRLHAEMRMDGKIGPVDRLWLMVMAERYKTKRGDIEALLRRVDIIPPSLALAQAAEESGWGTSRFVREGNAVFGQWTFSDDGHLVPARRDDDKSHLVRAFPSLMDSVRAYMRNLNTHRAYSALRRARYQLRLQGAPMEGLMLVDHLQRYSARGSGYVNTIKVIIEANDLRRLDDARLHDGEPSWRSAV